LAANKRLPAKQRYTSHRIYEELVQLGYQGGESTVRGYIGQNRREQRRPQVYLPLEFDPGSDAQVDWGEAVAEVAGMRQTAVILYAPVLFAAHLLAIVPVAAMSVTPSSCVPRERNARSLDAELTPFPASPTSSGQTGAKERPPARKSHPST
jgi:hypothetical protein